MSKLNELIQINQKERHSVLKKFELTNQDVKLLVKLLKSWLEEQNHLPHNIDNELLERFLLRNKFNLEKAKIKLDAYFTLRGLYPEMFAHCSPDDAQASICFPLPKLTPNFERAIIYKTTGPASAYDTKKILSRFLMMLEIVIPKDYSIGDRMVLDGDGFTWSHLLKVSLGSLKKAHKLHREAYSVRIAGIDIINPPRFLSAALAVLKLFLKKKIYERIRIHNELESLYEFIPREFLPAEYGGAEESYLVLQEKWDRELEVQREFLQKVLKNTSKEELRAKC